MIGIRRPRQATTGWGIQSAIWRNTPRWSQILLGLAHFKGKWSKQNGGKKLNIKGKKINAFGKTIPVIAIVLMVLTAGIAGAALVPYYFSAKGEVTVTAPLSVSPTEVYVVDTVAGNTREEILTVDNAAEVAIPVNLVTTISCGDITINGPGNFMTDGIHVSYLAENAVEIVQPVAIMPGTTKITAHIETNPAFELGDYIITTTAEPVANRKALILENKRADWSIIDDNTVAALIYNPSGDNFNYALVGSGLKPDTIYSLIYYADKPDRFAPENWGGDYPGALIGSGTTTTNGNLAMDGSINLNMNLPCPPDANIDGEDYRVTDKYSNAHGAKLWLVPSSDYNVAGRTIKPNWHPGTYLFETDLISYTDTNIVN